MTTTALERVDRAASRVEKFTLIALAIAVTIDITLSIFVGLLLVKVDSVINSIRGTQTTNSAITASTNTIVYELAQVEICQNEAFDSVLTQLAESANMANFRFTFPPTCNLPKLPTPPKAVSHG